MVETILQSYLNEQHIKTDVQENIDSLKKAVNEVKKYITRRTVNADIIPYTLVALDPKVKDNDPIVLHVEDIIIKKWPAFKNSVTATKDKSTTYVRAVILESLSQLAKGDAETAALVWLTARDVIGHYQLGSEESVISVLLQELADQTEENGQAAWSIGQKIEVPVFQDKWTSTHSVKTAHIDVATLSQYLKNGLIHSENASNAEGGENPHHVSDRNGRTDWQWGKFAADKIAEGISTSLKPALSQQTKEVSAIADSLKDGLDNYFTQFQSFFEDLITSFANSITANNKRSELLWWKQSLYSRSLNISYHSLNLLNAAVCMVLDLAEEVGAIYPESVDYLLRETLKDVHGEKAEEERLLTNWLNDISSLHRDIQSALNEYAAGGDERKPLLNAWANVVKTDDTTDFFTETGINKKAKLTTSDLALWLFHGLQAQKLATAKVR